MTVFSARLYKGFVTFASLKPFGWGWPAAVGPGRVATVRPGTQFEGQGR